MSDSPELTRRSVLRNAAAAGLLATPAAGLLAACAGSSDDGDNAGTGAKNNDNPFGVKDDSSVDVVIFNGGLGDEYAKFDKTLFDAKHSKVKLNLSSTQKIKTEQQPKFSTTPADLINNAGAEHSAPFHRTSPDDFRRMFEVNLLGAVNCTQGALPSMRERGWGRIVNVASTAGLKGYAYTTAYTASKHALVGLTRALAGELARTGVTVNAVCPGFTDTDLAARAVANIAGKTGRAPDAALAELTRVNPLGRLVRPEEVAAAVAWLCGEQANAVTGQAIAIDGGETA